MAAAVVVHHGSSRCLSGVSADFQTPKRRWWRLECRGGAKRAAQVFERSPAKCFFLFFFLFRFSCKFTHPADLRRDAPSLPSSSAADRDLRLLATAFDIISIGSLLSVYLFFYLPFLHNKRGISMKGSPYWSNSHLPLFFFFLKKESCQLSLVLATRKPKKRKRK